MNDVHLVRHPVNRGYGAAIKTGFSRARGELLAFLDADSTYPPASFASLCDVAIRERRRHRDRFAAVGWRESACRRFAGSATSSGRTCSPSSALARWRTRPAACACLRRSCLQQLYPLPDGLNFTPVMSTRSLHEGLKVVEIPIAYHERSGRSKLSVVRDGTRFLKTILWTALQYNPARILELAGFCRVQSRRADRRAARRGAPAGSHDAWAVGRVRASTAA